MIKDNTRSWGGQDANLETYRLVEPLGGVHALLP